ncbi:hypothetical protein [Mycolicibacterium bacteremicum]|nr:hypothetical protein [Mycolicibacterium bacteremicum]MCV7431583.1 hypothetical protein [Mycolicibacterium bacteremicum]
MKHLLNISFLGTSALFLLAPTVGLGGVFEALVLVVALLIGGLSVAGGLVQAERTLRRIEADTQPAQHV